jgi:hypothetical protein
VAEVEYEEDYGETKSEVEGKSFGRVTARRIVKWTSCDAR